MFVVLGVIVFGSCLVMAAWPLVAYIRMRTRLHVTDRYSRGVLKVYYAAILCLFVVYLLLTAGNVILFGLVVLGPLLALHIRAAMRGAASLHAHCPQCGYNLTGNVSGTCPECGRPVERRMPDPSRVGFRAGLPRWRAVIPIWLICVVLVLIAGGYGRVRTVFICSECARHEFRFTHIFAIAFGGHVLLEVPGSVETDPWGPDPLTPFLDPDGQCSHRWVGFGSNYGGIMGYPHSTAVKLMDPSRTAVTDKSDFAQFVAERPGVLERIRFSLRRKERIREWITDEYWTWEQAHGQDTEELPETPQP